MSPEQPTNSPESSEQLETIIEQLKNIKYFKTEKGSVYEYDENGHAKRKRYSGEECETKNITVFVNLDPKEDEDFIGAHQDKNRQKSDTLHIVENQPDNSLKIILDIKDVSYPGSLYLAIERDNAYYKRKPVALLPAEGLDVYEFKVAEKDGKSFRKNHLGHKVTEINYK
jgi:hypothetical protein